METKVAIRPLSADDGPALLEAFEHLSPETRRRRFLSAGARLSELDIARLTDVDHREHEALAALAEDGRTIVGVARYLALPGDARAAEVAVTVDDDWQNRGIGRRLVSLLTERARANGFERLVAYVDPENQRIIDWLDRSGATRTVDDAELVYTLAIGQSSALGKAA